MLWIKGNAPTLLVGMEIGAATMQNAVVEKIKNINGEMLVK